MHGNREKSGVMLHKTTVWLSFPVLIGFSGSISLTGHCKFAVKFDTRHLSNLVLLSNQKIKGGIAYLQQIYRSFEMIKNPFPYTANIINQGATG